MDKRRNLNSYGQLSFDVSHVVLGLCYHSSEARGEFRSLETWGAEAGEGAVTWSKVSQGHGGGAGKGLSALRNGSVLPELTACGLPAWLGLWFALCSPTDSCSEVLTPQHFRT